MKRREGKISLLLLCIVTFVTIGLMVLELNSKTKVKAEYFNEKIKAAEITSLAFADVKDYALTLNIPVDRINDPNETGLIGLQYSPLTSMRGDLNAKLTSTNPNFAALIVQLLKDAGVHKGDMVAISFSGSYPALNIACLSACRVLGLKPLIITSVGSSMWGANFPQLTYLDMERVLFQNQNTVFRTNAATIGGEDDVGRGFSPEGRALIIEAVNRNKIPLLDINTFEDAIRKRIAYYSNNGNPVLLVAIDDATWLGTDVPIGHIKPGQVRTGTGLIPWFSQQGKSVVHLSAINELAEKHGLPVAPIPLPEIGKGNLYYRYRYSVVQAVIFLGILVVILFAILRYDIDYYLIRRKK